MSKFITTAVGTEPDLLLSAENVLTVTRTDATHTFIQYNSAQAGFDTCTFTHTTDAATTKVRDAIKAAILGVHSGQNRPNVSQQVVLPTGVTVSGVVFS